MRILLAIDDSKFSEAATQAVIAQGRLQDLEVRVLHVVEPPSLLVAREMGRFDPAIAVAWQAEQEQGKVLVSKTAEVLRSRGIKAITAVVEGDPKSTIIDDAGAWNADLIVLGSHGRKGLERFLLGSVSDAVMRHAHCSVEIVRVHSEQ